MRRSRSLLLVVAFGAIAVALGIVIGAGSSAVAANETADESDWSLEELRSDGPQLGEGPASLRSDGDRMWWLKHWPASELLSSPGDPQDTGSEFVEPGGTVDRNAVYLRTAAVESLGERTVHVVYWREGERERETANGTITETAPVDVIHDTHTIDLESGMPIEEISLRQSDDPRQVTMWVEGAEEELRWTFEHDSTPTAEDAGIETRGDYLTMVAWQFLLPIVIGGAISGRAALGAVGRAGMGPGYPLSIWITMIALGSVALMLFAFDTLAELLASAPMVASGFVILVVGIVVLESQMTRDKRVIFFRPDTVESVTPRDDKGADAIMAAEQEETVVDINGRPAIVRRGLRPFLARVFGRAAFVDELAFETKIKLPTSRKDEMVVVDPDAPQVLDYEPEGFALDPPEPSSLEEAVRPLSILLGIAVVVGLIGSWLSWGAGLVVGGLMLLPILFTPVDGKAEVEPASAHVRKAWISTVTLAHEVDDAKTLDQAREKLVEQQSRTQQEVQAAVERQDSTLVEEMLALDLDRTLEDEEDQEVDDPLEAIDTIEVRSSEPEEVESDD